MNNKARLLGAAALGLMVAACGTDPQERVSGGAAAGAATGAGVGALGGPVGALAGAAIGGGAGAVTGAATSPQEVNLGRPVWNDPETRVPGVNNPPRSASASTTRQAQRALTARGFNAGGADGLMGPRTSQAASDFQRANNLPVTGRLDGATLAALNVGQGRSGMRGASRANPDAAYQGGGMVVAQPAGQARTSQAPMGTSPDRSGVATDADPGAGGTGGSGGSTGMATSPNYGGSGRTNPMERSGTATGADPGAGGTGGSGGGAMTAPTGPGVMGQPGPAGGPLERSGTATDADPGTGGTGGSGGGATGLPR